MIGKYSGAIVEYYSSEECFIPKKSKSMKTLPIPEGYNTLTPYITVKGARNAVEFYKKAFGAK